MYRSVSRFCDISVVIEMSNITAHLKSEYFSFRLIVRLPFLSTLLEFFLVPVAMKLICPDNYLKTQ